MADHADVLRNNILAMNALEGFDVTIVCCSSQKQANYWQKRLEDVRGSVLAPKTTVIAVQEDWPGGAGNGMLVPLFCRHLTPVQLWAHCLRTRTL